MRIVDKQVQPKSTLNSQILLSALQIELNPRHILNSIVSRISNYKFHLTHVMLWFSNFYYLVSGYSVSWFEPPNNCNSHHARAVKFNYYTTTASLLRPPSHLLRNLEDGSFQTASRSKYLMQRAVFVRSHQLTFIVNEVGPKRAYLPVQQLPPLSFSCRAFETTLCQRKSSFEKSIHRADTLGGRRCLCKAPSRDLPFERARRRSSRQLMAHDR